MVDYDDVNVIIKNKSKVDSVKEVIVIMILPHVVVVCRAAVPIVLVVVGFQLLIQVKGSLTNA